MSKVKKGKDNKRESKRDEATKMAQKKNEDKDDKKEKKEVDLPPIPSILTEEQLVEFREQFDQLLESEVPKIPVVAVCPLMRKLGMMPSENDIENIIQEMSPDGTLSYDGLTFEHFCCVAAKKIDEIYREEDVVASLNAFDKTNSGYLTVDELKEILQTRGEPLNEEEMNAFLECAQPDSKGRVRYRPFVRDMMLEF